MKNQAKKILAIVLAIATVCMMAPAAFADGGNVAKVGDTEYATVSEAIANANGKTVVLIDNATEDVVVPAGTTVTLDINGKTLTNKSGDTITNKGTLTIEGSGTIDNVTHAKCALLNDAGATATVKGSVTLTRSKEDGDKKGNTYYVIVNHGALLTIEENVKVTQDGNYSSMVENGWYNGNQNASKKNSKLVINGGTFSGGLNTIKNDDYGELEITGGTFENIVQSAVMNWNVATISGGEFTMKAGTKGTVVLNGKLDGTMDQGKLKITAGTFNGNGNAAVQNIYYEGYGNSSGDIEITGGTFNGDIVLGGEVAGGNVTIDAANVKMGSGNKVVVNDQAKDTVNVNGASMEYIKAGSDNAKGQIIYIGVDSIKEAAKNAKAGDTLRISGDVNVSIPVAGVNVVAVGNGKVVVNGDTVKETYVTKTPTTPSEDEETPTTPDKTPVDDEKPSKDPQTNSADELVTFTCVVFALAIGAAALVYSRKKRID